MGFANALCTYHTVGPENYDWNQVNIKRITEDL